MFHFFLVTILQELTFLYLYLQKDSPIGPFYSIYLYFNLKYGYN